MFDYGRKVGVNVIIKVKFHVDHDHLEEKCRAIVQDYTRGLQWVLQYYYHGVPSWDW